MSARSSWVGTRPWFQFLIRMAIGAVGLILVVSGLQKLIQPDLFAATVHDYALLPLSWELSFVFIVPWLEVLTGATLFAGVGVKVFAALGVGLLLSFCGAMLLVLIQGRTVECGCGVFSGEVSIWTILRDLLFAVPLLCVIMGLYPPHATDRQGETRADPS